MNYDEIALSAHPALAELKKWLFLVATQTRLKNRLHAARSREATANWYWMVDEIQAAHVPLLAEAKKAKAMMCNPNKNDKLDARGLVILLRNGTLPSVWIADTTTRDLRGLSRIRMALVHAAVPPFCMTALRIS